MRLISTLPKSDFFFLLSPERKLPSENNTSDKRIHTDKLLSNLATEAAQEISGMKSSMTSSSSSNSSDQAGASLSYTLGRVGAGSNAIAIAAARAVTNTLQVQCTRIKCIKSMGVWVKIM